MKYTLKFVWLFAFFLPALALAQGEAVGQKMEQIEIERLGALDSLKNLSFEDKCQEIRRVRQLTVLYIDTSFDSAMFYSALEMSLAAEIRDHSQLAAGRLNAANVLNAYSRLESAKTLLLANRADSNNISYDELAFTESALSYIYLRTEEYDKSISAALVAAKAFERLRDSVNAAFNYLSLADVHELVLEDQTVGLKYIQKAIALLRGNGAPKNYLIIALAAHGDLSMMQGEYDTALLKYEEANQIALDNDAFFYYSDILCGLGKVYYFKHEYQKSISYLEKSLSESGNHAGQNVRAYDYLGLNYQKLNQPEKAIEYYKLCIKYDSKGKRADAYKSALIDCYQQVADYEKAFKLQQELMVSRDSINEANQQEKVTEIVEKYENEKKEQEIGLLKEENTRKEAHIKEQYYIIGGIVLLALLFGFGGYSWLRIRQKLKEGIENMKNAQLQQRFLRVQLNPHFFFHALSSIEGYIYTNEKASAAAFLRNFGKLMRSILESSDMNFIPLKDDIEMIREYLILQQLNSDFKFEYIIDVMDELDASALEIPPMLIQPFVENAILHGALRAEKGVVTIRYTLQDNHVKISITDNGPGHASDSHKSGTLHRSMSTDIVKQRTLNLRELYGIDIKYSTSSHPETKEGTTVVVDLPMRFADEKSNAISRTTDAINDAAMVNQNDLKKIKGGASARLPLVTEDDAVSTPEKGTGWR